MSSSSSRRRRLLGGSTAHSAVAAVDSLIADVACGENLFPTLLNFLRMLGKSTSDPRANMCVKVDDRVDDAGE